MKKLSLVFVCAALSALTGCMSSKYKLAKEGTPPPEMLYLSTSQKSVETVLHCVIVYQGPGSWKREAYWDEYVVSVFNRRAEPLKVVSATLTDFQAAQTIAADDPWALEAQSKTWWQKVKSSQTGGLLSLGAGSFALAGTLAVASIAADGGLFAASTAGGAALGAAAGVVLVAAPIYAVTVIVINSKNKKRVVEEFNRRRLALPLTIAPGEKAQGSFFFRISPGPQRLTLHGFAGGETVDVDLDLTPLKGLHMKAPPGSVLEKH